MPAGARIVKAVINRFSETEWSPGGDFVCRQPTPAAPRGPSQSTLVFAAVLVVIVLVAVLVLVLVSRHDRAPKNDPAAQATPTAQVTEQDTVLAEAKHLAAQYTMTRPSPP